MQHQELHLKILHLLVNMMWCHHMVMYFQKLPFRESCYYYLFFLKLLIFTLKKTINLYSHFKSTITRDLTHGNRGRLLLSC